MYLTSNVIWRTFVYDSLIAICTKVYPSNRRSMSPYQNYSVCRPTHVKFNIHFCSTVSALWIAYFIILSRTRSAMPSDRNRARRTEILTVAQRIFRLSWGATTWRDLITASRSRREQDCMLSAQTFFVHERANLRAAREVERNARLISY